MSQALKSRTIAKAATGSLTHLNGRGEGSGGRAFQLIYAIESAAGPMVEVV